MPNTYVSRSKLSARAVWICRFILNGGHVDFVEAGHTQRRYYVAWA